MTRSKVYDICSILLLTAISFLFLYKLGDRSLVSWDEAWYADIARNIIKNSNPIFLTWNGKAFLDHPPFGFWLIALSFKAFGVTEFASRFPSAIFGFLTLIFVYFLGKEMFNRKVGFLSAISLTSAYWFTFRARSGNLDIFLTCLFVSSIYFFLKFSKERKFLIPTILSLFFLFMTKTLIPFTILPVLFFIVWKSDKKSRANLTYAIFVSLSLFFVWFINNSLFFKNFVSRYFAIGAPGVKFEADYIENIKQVKRYIYEGIGRWFWPSIISVCFSIFLFQKRFLILFIFILSFTLPFLFSLKGQIWHLIPLQPFMLLALFGFSYIFLKKLIKKELVVFLILLVVTIYQSFIQIKRSWYESINTDTYTSDEEILSAEAGKFDGDFYIDSDFVPAAVFYSQKNVKQFSDPTLSTLFNKSNKFSLITYKWRIEQANINKREYEIVGSDRDKILLVRK